MKINLLIIVFIMVGILNSCEDPDKNGDSDLNENTSPKISLSADSESTSLQGEVELSVNVSNLDLRIFALSMRISFDSTKIVIDESQTGWMGDIWTEAAIGILKPLDQNIHLSVSEVSHPLTLDTGVLFSISVVTESIGTASFRIDPNFFFCFDSTGAEIQTPDIEFVDTEITIN